MSSRSIATHVQSLNIAFFDRRVLLAAISTLLPFTLLSQTRDIRGVVSDSATGKRIPYANVLVLGTERGASTNVDGFFLIPSVPPGSYQVVASVLGYNRQLKRVEVRGDRAIVLNFRLVAVPIGLPGVAAE